MKGKERENSASVYLSVLRERGAEGTGGGEDGAEGGGFGSMPLDLFVSEKKIKKRKQRL